MNHVQGSRSIQAENQREHLQPGVRSWPCTLLPIPPCTRSMTPRGMNRNVPPPLLPCRAAHTAATSQGTLNFALFAVERGKSSCHVGVMPLSCPGDCPDYETPVPGSPQCPWEVGRIKAALSRLNQKPPCVTRLWVT